jgi:thiol-disulfide isomerase/thioredoxin
MFTFKLGMTFDIQPNLFIVIEWIKSHPGMTILLIVLVYRTYDHWFYEEPAIAASRVTQINTMDQLEDQLNNNPFVVDNFAASWCPACRAALPSFANWLMFR